MNLFLVSAPLPGGDGGLVCACANLTKATIGVDIILQSNGGGSACNGLSNPSGIPVECESFQSNVTMCKVRRDDGKAISKKHVLCTLSALDVNGNPTTVVPVDIKFRK